MDTISQDEAFDLIRGSKGKLFSAKFEKRTKPGVIRRMVARTGVRKGVTGEGQSFNPRDHGLVTVHEFVTAPNTVRNEKGQFAGGGNLITQFRNIPAEGLRELRIGGKTYQIQ